MVDLIDRAVDLPPGPELSTLLARLPWAEVPNARLVEVLQARSRQLAHDQAQLFAGMAEITRATPVAGLPDDAVSRADDDFEWASHEIAAALTWTPTTADRELDFAQILVRGLPLVFAALDHGLIDRGRAKVFCDHLDPARGELTEAQIRRLCERFVPLAPRLTARQLSRRLLAAIQAIDPDHHRRRYERGLRERGVVLHLNRDGTATLSGEGLPPEEAAAAAARLDRLAEAARRAGHPGRLSQISADLYLGMLDGSFHGLTEAQILAGLLTHPRPEDHTTDPDHVSDPDDTAACTGSIADDAGSEGTCTEHAGDTGDTATAGGVAASDPTATTSDPTATTSDPTATTSDPTATTSDPTASNPTASDPTGTNRTAAHPTAADPTAPDPTAPDPTAPDPTAPDTTAAGAMSAGAGADRWRDERIGTREGIEIRAGLTTLMGRDQRPAEIPGLGPIDAETARTAVARQRRGAQWQFAVVDSRGYLLLAGPLRRRPGRTPTGAGPPNRVRGGVVELHLTLAELRRFGADPDLTGDWAGVIAEIAERWADRHRLWRELDRNPRARFARGALALHVRVRDRTCVGPCCDRSARRSDLDHTIDHGRGGDTVEGNIGPGCRRHHPDKDRGWRLSQPEPGHFVWISPLGRTYRTRGEPIRPDLPDPEPPPEGSDQRENPDTDHGNPLDLRVLWREGRDPAPPPPSPAPDTEEEPPF
ncbi:DUF222 domain-containing protein [Pseudonocardia adelaidensis]|uniref:DUF222 domain-containing protein n=1 Tax=Pseudonocardia adelaidensis TaxID=648754 RepID=A0ABP9NHI2_9PSEU